MTQKGQKEELRRKKWLFERKEGGEMCRKVAFYSFKEEFCAFTGSGKAAIETNVLGRLWDCGYCAFSL